MHAALHVVSGIYVVLVYQMVISGINIATKLDIRCFWVEHLMILDASGLRDLSVILHKINY